MYSTVDLCIFEIYKIIKQGRPPDDMGFYAPVPSPSHSVREREMRFRTFQVSFERQGSFISWFSSLDLVNKNFHGIF